MANNQNILFYSNQCATCASLIRILKVENMINYFNCICVDDVRVRQKLPKNITQVPTIILPAMNKILVAGDIFLWLKSVKMAQRGANDLQRAPLEQPSTKQDNRQQNKQQTPNQPVNQSNPIGFVSHEMSGVSDNYAYMSSDAVPQHTYLSCSELGKNSIFTAPEAVNKITMGLHDTCIKRAENARKEQDTNLQQLFKQQHQHASYMDEKNRENNKIIEKIVEKQQQNLVNLTNGSIR